tara:strand:- start:538 stop:711 length:174 start_codon:yes stop_codon:yes gene_type:complete
MPKVKMTHYKLDCPLCDEFLDTAIMQHSFMYITEREKYEFVHKECHEIFWEMNKKNA